MLNTCQFPELTSTFDQANANAQSLTFKAEEKAQASLGPTTDLKSPARRSDVANSIIHAIGEVSENAAALAERTIISVDVNARIYKPNH
jgi:hypothetical protein